MLLVSVEFVREGPAVYAYSPGFAIVLNGQSGAAKVSADSSGKSLLNRLN